MTSLVPQQITDETLATFLGGSDPLESPDFSWPLKSGVTEEAWPIAHDFPQIALTPPPYAQLGLQL